MTGVELKKRSEGEVDEVLRDMMPMADGEWLVLHDGDCGAPAVCTCEPTVIGPGGGEA